MLVDTLISISILTNSTVIVYKNGKSAFNAEHSAMDGMITLRLNEFVIGTLASKKITLGEKRAVKQSDVEELPFELDSKARDYVTNAEKHHDAIMGAHSMDVRVSLLNTSN